MNTASEIPDHHYIVIYEFVFLDLYCQICIIEFCIDEFNFA